MSRIPLPPKLPAQSIIEILEQYCSHCGEQVKWKAVWTGQYSSEHGLRMYWLRFHCPNKKRFWDQHNAGWKWRPWDTRARFNQRDILEAGFKVVDNKDYQA